MSEFINPFGEPSYLLQKDVTGEMIDRELPRVPTALLPDTTIARQAQEIVPIDITGKTVDILTFLPSYTNPAVNNIRIVCKTASGAANISNIPEKQTFFMEYFPTYNNLAATTGLASGRISFTTTGAVGTPRRKYDCWYLFTDGNAVITPWVLDGTASTSITTLEKTGTPSELNAWMSTLGKFACHNLTLKIPDGDYSTETLTIPATLVCNGDIFLRAETEVLKGAPKAVKLKNVSCNRHLGVRIEFQYIDFEGGDTENIFGVNYNNSHFRFTHCDFRQDKTAIVSTSYFGIYTTQYNNMALEVNNCRFNWLERAIYSTNPSKTIVTNCEFANCNYGIFAALGEVVDNGGNTFPGTKVPIYRALGGSITNEVQTFKRWSSGNYTGVTNEFVFAKLTQAGSYRVTITRTGTNGIGSWSWIIHNGSMVVEAKKDGGAGQSGQASSVVNLQYSNLAGLNTLLKAVCSNPNIAANTNSIAVTITPLHATDNDGFVTLSGQGESLTDTPSTWVTI